MSLKLRPFVAPVFRSHPHSVSPSGWRWCFSAPCEPGTALWPPCACEVTRTDIDIHTHTHAYTHTNVPIFIHIYIHTRTYILVHIYMYMHVYARHINTSVNTYIIMHIYTYLFVYFYPWRHGFPSQKGTSSIPIWYRTLQNTRHHHACLYYCQFNDLMVMVAVCLSVCLRACLYVGG